MITDRVKTELTEAVKAGDQMKVQALRLLLSSLEYQKINKRQELTEEEEISSVKQEIKKRKEAIDAYTKAGYPDRAEKEATEEAYLMTFMPTQASDEEIAQVIKMIMEENPEMNRGQMIGEVIKRIGKEKVDGGRVISILNQ